MQKIYLVVAAAGLLLAFGSVAEAKGPGASPGLGGGGGQPSAPPGLSNTTGGHNGFDDGQPKGWDQGKATWKTDPNDATQPLPPGFNAGLAVRRFFFFPRGNVSTSGLVLVRYS